MAELRVGVLGASSLVGRCVLPLLSAAGWQMVAFSRRPVESSDGMEWRVLSPSPPAPISTNLTVSSPFKGEVRWGMGSKSGEISPIPTPALPLKGRENDASTPKLALIPPAPLPRGERGVGYWICVAPIWVLPDCFSLIEASGARRVVALSSTSRFTKVGSGDTAENAVAAKLIESEARVQAWAESRGIEWVVLRPTLIYGLGRDKNISEMARFIRRFGFFPLLGSAQGLRQPIHADDVAAACVAALLAPAATDRAYNISGGETLAYRDMVARVFAALGRPVRLVTVPLWVFRWAVAVMRALPRYRHWSVAMAERMNRDMVFDHAEAARDLGFKPRGFALAVKDLA